MGFLKTGSLNEFERLGSLLVRLKDGAPIVSGIEN
ncbi:MAG: hypothetical protein C5S44_04860 [Candidatus Methanocomedens sp.]|jgi:hypothetical protein|nr:MAG: hypothetical protein C5S44_04860 [ANME-2 cluster archaeon]